jgi:DNA-binding transcriptional LysR family regulator
MDVQPCYALLNMSDFNWALVPSFLAAHTRGSLLGAARQLGVSQPTVGRHIAQLEAQLGTPLFERTPRGLVPTAAARRLADAALAMEAGAQSLVRGAQQSQTALSGTVRISASQPVACVLLPPVLTRLRREMPSVQIELVSSNAISDLMRREADIAVRMVRPSQGSLVARRIGQVALTACAHRDYLRTHGTPHQATDLLTHELVGDDHAREIERGFAAMGYLLDPARIALRTDDMIAYWSAVRAGMGIGFVARYMLREDPQVRVVLPELPLPALPVWLVVHREIRSVRRVRAVYDALAREMPGLF